MLLLPTLLLLFLFYLSIIIIIIIFTFLFSIFCILFNLLFLIMYLSVILTGTDYTGKSSIITRFVKDEMRPNMPTLGVDFSMNIDGYIIKLQIWDTCGRERFQTIISRFALLHLINTQESTN